MNTQNQIKKTLSTPFISGNSYECCHNDIDRRLAHDNSNFRKQQNEEVEHYQRTLEHVTPGDEQQYHCTPDYV